MHERVCHRWVKQRAQESETLCRKGGTSRSDNAPHASGARVVAKLALWCHPFCDAGICGACAGAQLACGVTLSATREFVGLARLLNSLVVAAMITQHHELSKPTRLKTFVTESAPHESR